MIKIIPVIMAGGFGARLWPLSNEKHPKQFLKLFNELSILQQTILRNYEFGKSTIVVNQLHQEIAINQINELELDVNLITEPISKNTAPPAIFTALYNNTTGNEFLLFLPSDHYVEDKVSYIQTITKALYYTSQHPLIVIGTKITNVNNNYGYIKVAEQIDNDIYIADEFIEKPELNVILNLDSTNYFWNSGILIINCDFLLKQIKILQPNLYLNVYESYITSKRSNNVTVIPEYPYSNITSISFDHAVMEHMKNMLLVKAGFAWQDLGNWSGMYQMQLNSQKSDNVFMDATATEYISQEMVLLVQEDPAPCRKSYYTDESFSSSKTISPNNPKYFRNWGYYEIISNSNLHKTKKITIYPNCKLSLQYHNHRCEHWVIIEGTGEVKINNQTKPALPNDSFYISTRSVHQIKNIGTDNLCFIEVQTGDYLEEDDIVRLDNV